MPVLEILTSSGLGSLLGMRHALEPDHLAAVSTLVTGERSNYKAALLGACWGLGHTFSLLAAGIVLVVLRTPIGRGCVRVLRRVDVDRPRPARYLAARERTKPAHAHHHGPLVHVHEGTPAPCTSRPDARPASAITYGPGSPAAARSRRSSGHAALHRGAAHLHGGVRIGIDAGDGGAVGPARLADRTPRQPSWPGARDFTGRRLRLDGARRRVGISAAREAFLGTSRFSVH